MDAKMPKAVKPKRRKKSQSRTEVTNISDSESDTAPKSQSLKAKAQPAATKSISQTKPTSVKVSSKPALVKDSALAEKFTSHYLQRITTEFSEDLDKIREADDFNENALQILVHALKQGTEVWGEEEMRRVVG
ncbi:uncharacterized protein EAF01_001469 [Botrytis porri]|uniref:Ribosome assembly protein 3 n=1 Tax=Botrytis porri TaxID=87229 RepID=A0A4Z1KGT8_9HELO|nr:uncharacterized protein EAF01_001469 [Botrytis porri]KAF7912448.1 hypothetical protein EAF01_001469 [Botrytis porri]TGO85303.1 hypothetical protein BPOR_0410g00040 [Botrytis porri]